MDGFAILGSYALIGIVWAFYAVTTQDERDNWSHNFMAWFAFLATLATLWEWVPDLVRRLGGPG